MGVVEEPEEWMGGNGQRGRLCTTDGEYYPARLYLLACLLHASYSDAAAAAATIGQQQQLTHTRCVLYMYCIYMNVLCTVLRILFFFCALQFPT